MAGEMVAFENGVKGIALNLEESSVGVMILGEYTGIEEGDTVTATGACSACRSARRWSAAWSTDWASRSTSKGRSRPTRPGRWNPRAGHRRPTAG